MYICMYEYNKLVRKCTFNIFKIKSYYSCHTVSMMFLHL